MEIEQTVTIPSAQLCAWLTEQGVEVGTNARLSISKGADGSETSTMRSPETPSATKASVPTSATSFALPGVSRKPRAAGAAGSETW